jgi:hypothetical protein
MKRMLLLAVVVLSATILSPVAGADRREKFSGSTSFDPLHVNTTGCPDFVTVQPDPIKLGFNFTMDASWKGTWIPVPPFQTIFSDVRGTMKGTGVDVNTGLTYELNGKFSEDIFTQDILGTGDFKITRSDGAQISFTATFQVAGVGSPALFGPTDVVCKSAEDD